MKRLLISLVCLMYFSLSIAQGAAPELKINALKLALGDTLELSGKNLPADTVFKLKLSNPSEAVVSDTVQSSATGDLAYQVSVDQQGIWQLDLEGKGVTERFRVLVIDQTPLGEVSPAPSTESSSTNTPPAATPVEPAPGESPAQAPQETTPSGSAQTETQTAQQNTEAATPEVPTDAPESSAAQIPTPSSEPQTATSENTAGPAAEANPATPDATPPTETPATQPETPAANTLPDNTTAPLSETLAGIDVAIENDSIIARQNGTVIWQFDFPLESGSTRALAKHKDAIYAGHGNSLLAFEPQSGKVLNRWIVSGPITQLESTTDALKITATLQSGINEQFNLVNGALQETVRFGVNLDMFSWLEHEAEVEDVAARLAQDPSNPYLHLRAGQQASDAATARAAYQEALKQAQTFYDYAALSRAFLQAGETDLADQAFDAALKDFAARGYDPRLLRNMDLHEAYRFPLKPFREALAANNAAEAAFWAKWLHYLSNADVPQVQNALQDYATFLQDQGDRSAAKLWRDNARLGRRTSLAGILENLFSGLGRVGWYSVWALLLAILALHVTLVFKYWIPQTVVLKRRQATGKKINPFARFFAIRYYSFTEELVILLMLIGVAFLASLASWNDRTDVTAIEGQSGTLASAVARDYVNVAPFTGVRAAYIKGYAAQAAGDITLAQENYAKAGDFAPAINNLGVLNQDPALYQKALELAPGLPEARYNLGQELSQFPFQQTYLFGEPVLAAPSREDMQAALAGTWQDAIAAIFVNPWTGLRDLRPAGIHPYLWLALVVLFLVWVIFTIFWLLIPRPRIARNAPRTFLYNLFSVLIPGSGLADEMWGLLLIVPWAIVGLDALSDLFGWGFGIGFNLRWDYITLFVIYLINIVAVIVEFISYRRRMNALKKKNPELAQEFRLLR